MIQKEWMTIKTHRQLAENIYEMTVTGKLAKQINEPGQFLHIRVNDSSMPLLRRPISICSYNHQEETVTMIYRASGKGTSLLATKKAGDVIDVLGPLGNGFPVDVMHEGETALLVGGGIGVPPLYELSKQLVAKGVKVVNILGFQTSAVAFYEKEFGAIGQTYVATVDGTLGTKGFVTDVMDSLNIPINGVFSCGPNPMLRVLETRFTHIERTYISLEERMGCGIGACFACVCHTQADPTGTEYRKVCSDGPVFQAGEVVI